MQDLHGGDRRARGQAGGRGPRQRAQDGLWEAGILPALVRGPSAMPIATPAACARVAQSFGKKGKGLDPLTLSNSKTSCNAAVTPAARAGGQAGGSPAGQDGTGLQTRAESGRGQSTPAETPVLFQKWCGASRPSLLPCKTPS